ncbi:MAG TPA: hypothetical protein VNJ29_03755 [Candidatus Nitrosotenuis sp.]|nr:hypothetical protein [Candidatus Nitrosotenuis sp.]
MPKPDNKTLIEVYKVTLGEEQFFNNTFENRLAFFTGLLSSLLTAIILGIFYAKDTLEFVALLVGPIALVLVAVRGIHAVKRASERISKILTVRAKIEQALGLTTPFRSQGKISDLYWEKEPIVNVEHLESRKKHKSSSEFIQYAMNDKKGYLTGIITFFRIFILIGFLSEGIILYKVVSLIV